MSTILIRNGIVITMDESNTVYSPGWVYIEGRYIAALGTHEPPPSLVHLVDRIIDANNMAVIPGLVNGHTHLSQTFMRNITYGVRLQKWLKQFVWPIQSMMSPSDVFLASQLGLVESLRSGVTSVVQHHKVITSPAHVDAVAEAARSVGMRMCLVRGWVDKGKFSEDVGSVLNEVSRLYKQWQTDKKSLITVGIGPMVLHRCSDVALRQSIEFASELGIPIHIHIAETYEEVKLLYQAIGMSQIEWLHTLGVMNYNVHLVHAVWVDDRDIDLIAKNGAIVVYCPVSNMYLASGIAPIWKMLKYGIPIALGTDGAASNNSQNMLETLKIAALQIRANAVHSDMLLSADILRMATTSGAYLFGDKKLGRIVVGANTDISIINLNTVRSVPIHCPESTIVYSTVIPDVHTVIVDGHVILDNGRITTIDEGALLEQCHIAAERLLKRAGVNPVC